MSGAASHKAPPLDDVMLAMDVVDTLRHRQDLVARELDGASREQQLIEKLKRIYQQQGIEVPDHILREGVAALSESRFAYVPPRPGFRTTLARGYVSRGRWGRPILIAGAVLLLLVAAYFLAYRPYAAARAEAARVELAETLPAEMDALYTSIFEETKVQSAVTEAADARRRGLAAAREGDRAGVEAAIGRLRGIRDVLRQEYSLRVVNEQGEDSGIWRSPIDNRQATSFYLIVEAIPRDGGAPLSLPILNEETGDVETVARWGVRVPRAVYERAAADKRDDGIIQGNVIGRKEYGYLDVDYAVPVLGGAVTRWND